LFVLTRFNICCIPLGIDCVAPSVGLRISPSWPCAVIWAWSSGVIFKGFFIIMLFTCFIRLSSSASSSCTWYGSCNYDSVSVPSIAGYGVAPHLACYVARRRRGAQTPCAACKPAPRLGKYSTGLFIAVSNIFFVVLGFHYSSFYPVDPPLGTALRTC
jgi:hypothetical protein